MKKTHALFKRSIVKQFFHTVLVSRRRIGRCEIFNLESSSSDYCRSVSCQGMSHHIAPHILFSCYTSHSHIKTRNTTLHLQPPTLATSQQPSGLSLTANLFIVTSHTPPPASVLMSTCTYFFVRHKLEETILDCHSEFIHHRMLLVSQNYKSFKYGMRNMKK